MNSWYNSFVITFRKRMSGGVEFVANYTLAKAIDGGQVPGSSARSTAPIRRSILTTASSSTRARDLDQRHRFVGNVIWIPQFTKKIANRALRYLLDGFAFSTIVTIATGQPVTGTISGNPAGAIAGGPTGGAVNNSGTATGGRSPGLARNLYTGPGMGDVDFRISREFHDHGAAASSRCWARPSTCSTTPTSSAVNTQQYTYTGAGTGACAGTRNGCLVPVPSFLTPSATNNNLFGARQLQISGRITF